MSAQDLSGTRDAIKRFARDAVEIEPDEVLFLEGEASNELYLLVSGEVEVFRGGRRLARISEPGSILGEMSSILGERRSATLRTVARCRFLVFEAAKVPELLQDAPALSMRLIRSLSERLANTNRMLDEAKEKVDFLEKRTRSLLASAGRTEPAPPPAPVLDPETDFPEAPPDPLHEGKVDRPTTMEYRVADLGLDSEPAKPVAESFGSPGEEPAASPHTAGPDALSPFLESPLGQKILERHWADLGDHFTVAGLAAEWDALHEEIEAALGPFRAAGLVTLGSEGGFFRLPDSRELWEALRTRAGE